MEQGSVQGSSQKRAKDAVAQALEAGGVRRAEALAGLHGAVARLAFDTEGCRTVQLALQVGSQKEAAALAAEMRGRVREAFQSPCANFVLQKVIEALPPSHAEFVVAELAGLGATVARHRFGCRILCRLLEHAAFDPRTAALVDEVLEEAPELCRHQFGHYVMECVLEHGSTQQQQKVVRALLENVLHNATHRNGSHVFEKALTYAPAEDRNALAEAVLAAPEGLAFIGGSQFGLYVVRALLELHGAISDRVKEGVRQSSDKLETSKYGKRIVEGLAREL